MCGLTEILANSSIFKNFCVGFELLLNNISLNVVQQCCLVTQLLNAIEYSY